MDISLARSFEKSLAKLARGEQALVKQTVMDFMLAPNAGGHRLHGLNMRERRFHSISPSMDLRIIVLKDGPRIAMMYVGHHDPAYQWTKDRRVETHPVTGSAQIVEFEEVIREEIVRIARTVVEPFLSRQCRLTF
jgi:hypothetical protein